MIHDFSTQKKINNPKVVTEKPRIPELAVKAQAIAAIPSKQDQKIQLPEPRIPDQPETIESPPVVLDQKGMLIFWFFQFSSRFYHFCAL